MELAGLDQRVESQSGRATAASPGSAADLILRRGDRLRVRKQVQEVAVIGEVQNETSHKHIYVVQANGNVLPGTGSSWFRSAGNIRRVMRSSCHWIPS